MERRIVESQPAPDNEQPQHQPLQGFSSQRQFPAASIREVVSLLLIVLLADVTVYRGQGYSGYAVLFTGVPLLFLAGAIRQRVLGVTWLLAVLLAATALRLVWCGNSGAVLAGTFLTACFAMAQYGLPPWVLHTLVFTTRLFGAGHRALTQYWQLLSHWSPAVPRAGLLSVVFPLLTLGIFGLIFTLANPDLLAVISSELEQLVRTLNAWLADFTPEPI